MYFRLVTALGPDIITQIARIAQSPRDKIYQRMRKVTKSLYDSSSSVCSSYDYLFHGLFTAKSDTTRK